MSTTNIASKLDALIRARNAAHEAQQAFADQHVAVEPDPAADALYEATHELIHRLDNLIDSIQWQNLVLIDEA